MNEADIEKTTAELIAAYPGCRVVVAENRGEMIAENSTGRAVAMIERSQQHFHRNLRETYRVLHGTLYVVCGGRGHVLQKG